MIKKINKRIFNFIPNSYSFSIALVVVFLFLGIIAGCIVSVGNIYASNDLKEVIVNGINDYTFYNSFYNFIKYPLLIFLLGWTLLGVFLIPITVFFKGFFLAYSIMFLLNSFGINGLLVSFASL